MNFECAVTEEMLNIACEIAADLCLFSARKRQKSLLKAV